MKMKLILESMSEISDEEFKFEYPEFKRISVTSKNTLLKVECDIPEILGDFMTGSDDMPSITTYYRRFTYVYNNGIEAVWFPTEKCYKFYYHYKDLIAIFYLK